MIDSKLLRCFLSVVDHRNVTAAANALHLSQPALSKNIQRLESELGVRLFERRPGGVIPTEYGLALARRARLIEHELRLASSEIEAMKEGGSGSITVGAGPLWTVYGLPEVLASLLQQKLKIKVRLLTGVLDTLIPDLLKGLGLKSLPVGGTFWRFRAGIAYRRSSDLSPLTSALIAALKAHFRTGSGAVSTAGAQRRKARRTPGGA